MSNRKDQLARLEEIIAAIDELAEEAAQIVREVDSFAFERAKAYAVFDMTSSSNRYDTTLTTILEELQHEEEADEE